MERYVIRMDDVRDTAIGGNTVTSLTDWARAGVWLGQPPTATHVSGQDGGTGPGRACTDKAG